MRTLYAAILFLAIASLAAAAPYRTINCQPAQGAASTGTVHQRALNVVRIATVAQINPAYTSAYAPDGYDSATQADLLAEVRRLTARLDAQARAGVAPPAPAANIPPPAPKGVTQGGGVIGLAVLTAKCAQCHQTGKLAPDQRFALLDAKGNLATLTDRQKLRVLLKAYSGQMPPPMNVYGVTPLTDAEYAAIVDLVQ